MSRDNLRNQARSQFNKQKPLSRDDAKNAAGDTTQYAHPSGSRDPADAAGLAAQEQRYDQDQGVDAAGGAKQGLSNLRNTASENVPDETKDRAREYRNRGQDYLREKLPKERREQSIWRLKKMIVEVQGHPDCMFNPSLCIICCLLYFRPAGHRDSA